MVILKVGIGLFSERLFYFCFGFFLLLIFFFLQCCQGFSLFCCCFLIKLSTILKGNILIKVAVVKEIFMARLGSISNDLEVFFEAIYPYSSHLKLK